ncbi:GIY-YIG nuclease family protein [Frateuria sp. Soil773]|uniref:GIY-YIG nuclease family protein n=1 Tax=Frateuria sp. Soil773 TaxID=1736407 RepID=UPI0012F98D79|nr:GIY-YIG nuclease family protein [Frateuria sp. Soil773]
MLYALLFEAGQVYIGQTTDAKRREKEHRRAWAAPFRFAQLEEMTGTQREAEDHEYAWRHRAASAGYVVVAKSWAGATFVVTDTRNRMDEARWAIVRRLRWPRELRMRRPWAWFWNWIAWQGGAVAGVVMGLRVVW